MNLYEEDQMFDVPWNVATGDKLEFTGSNGKSITFTNIHGIMLGIKKIKDSPESIIALAPIMKRTK